MGFNILLQHIALVISINVLLAVSALYFITFMLIHWKISRFIISVTLAADV